ncbi:hypothetical protein NESM_000686000 [Novymonas esmeraldas]|uniref:Uncharacterized protein n=1 Tax=Novymonas esmeraldas TaxID=1808958 RepID=A0AAW0ET89_9TRYP
MHGDAGPRRPTAPPTVVAVPTSAQRFYITFLSHLADSRGAPTAEAQDDGGEEDAVRRLSSTQADALGPLLWQWLALLSLPATVHAATDTAPVTPPPRRPTLSPHGAERLFTAGFNALVPAQECGGRRPPADPPAPWHAATCSPPTPSHQACAVALSTLSRAGPLFSAWCALCYSCIGPSLQHEHGDDVDRAVCGALHRLCAAWDTAAAEPTAGSPPRVGATASARAWAAVHTACTVSSGADHQTAPPLSLALWACQWHHECWRVAAHGQDDGFHTGGTAPSAPLVRRIMHYLCSRLVAEVRRRAPRSAGVAASHHPRESVLRIGHLEAAALEPPMQPDDHTTADQRRGGARGSAPSAQRRHRRRQRPWRGSDEEDGDESGDERAPASADGGAGALSRSSGAVGRLQQRRFRVGIAAGVLTIYSLAVLGEADGSVLPRAVSETHLRQGVVHWGTRCDPQRHGQLAAEGRGSASL